MISRRNLLKLGGIFSIPGLLGGVNVNFVKNLRLEGLFEETDDRILVLIQQNGGNDGLNMVIPLDQYDNLFKVRSNIMLPENQIIKLRDDIGLHPAMTGLRNIFNEGQLSIVQNVGYANQNRSHFRSTDIWDTGSRPQEILTTGWIGRYLDTVHTGYPVGYPNEANPHPIAITLGPNVSENCQGIAANFSLAITDPTSLTNIPGVGSEPVPDLPYGDELNYLRQIAEQTNLYSGVLKEVSAKGKNVSMLYPETGQNRLADQLKIVAQLISGGLQTKIFVVNINGFDTHANQVSMNDTTAGDHAILLSQLSEAISAFMDDLKLQNLDHRVLGMTRSEFGRQIASNGSFGTDHGDAAPLLLFGTCIDQGIIGSNPVIPNQVEPQSGIPASVDFKDVFGSILHDWFNVSRDVIHSLFTHSFNPIKLINDSCNLSTSAFGWNDDHPFSLEVFPNPFIENFTVSLQGNGTPIRLSLFNQMGQMVKTIDNIKSTNEPFNKQYAPGNLPPGNYYLTMETIYGKKSVPLIHF